MGKKNKKRSAQQHDGHHKKKKRHKSGGFWIDTCHESKTKEGKACLMTVAISQADLVDNHTHVGQETKKKSASAKSSDERTTEESKNGYVGEEKEPGASDSEAAETKPFAYVKISEQEVKAANEEEPADKESTKKPGETTAVENLAKIDKTSGFTASVGVSSTKDATQDVDYSHAFISVKRLPSACRPKKVV